MVTFILSYIFIFMLFIEIFTVLLQLGGLTRSKSRFQVLSLLTTSGFKTKESELITNDAYKRKIALLIMMFTYISLMIFISSLVYIAVHEEILTFFVYALVEIIMFYTIFTSLTMKKIVYSFVSWITKKFLLEKDVNTIKVFEEYNNKVLAQISLHVLPTDLDNTEIQAFEQLTTLEIQILAIQRSNVLINTVLPTQKIQLGDVVTVYGDLINIQYLFKINK